MPYWVKLGKTSQLLSEGHEFRLFILEAFLKLVTTLDLYSV
jgi:hypothetical protein